MITLTKVRTWHCNSNQVWEVIFVNEKGRLEHGRGVCDRWAEPTARQVIDHLRDCRLTNVANIQFYDRFVEKRDSSILTRIHTHARIAD